ncbi:MAG: hypothetical protein ACREOM_08735, partial [Candidatus Dormibacteraceae bacterium]
RGGRLAVAGGSGGQLTEVMSRPESSIHRIPFTGASGGTAMNSAVRWRIVSLQSLMVIVLAAAAGFAFYEGSFVTSQVRDELTAQQTSFPAASEIKAGGALDPAEFPQEIRDQAGNQVTTGDQARIYANDFIGIHLKGVAGGLTYSQMGTLSAPVSAQLATTPKTDPNYAVLQAKLATIAGQKDTLLNGEMLRASLLNSYGWWTLGVYASYAGIGLLIAALAVLGGLVFELFIAVRKTETFKLTPAAIAPRSGQAPA